MKRIFYILISILLLIPSIAEAQLTGKFSVSSSKQVQFSPGLLRYNCANSTWSFASNQYTALGSANTSLTGFIDLFGWGTSGYNGCMPTERSINATYGGGGSSIAGTQYDWGVRNFTGYRTLTQSEWDYLLNTRTNATALRAPGKVNGVCGYILLPDNWSKPSGITFVSREDGANAYTANEYTTTQFATMENAGAVFLPVTGYRYSSGSAAVVAGTGSMGYYWSASSANVSFMGNYIYCSSEMEKYMGLAVRLVYDASSSGSTTKYTITTAVSPAGTGTVSGAGQYTKNSYATIQATPVSGYVFDHFEGVWSTGSNTTSQNNPWQVQVYRDGTITAYFKKQTYSVFAHSRNEAFGTVEPSFFSGEKGQKVTFVATPKPGCRFVQWEDGVTSASRTYTIKGTEDPNNPPVFYATFESVSTYSVTVSSAQPSMGSVTTNHSSASAGSWVIVTANPKKGYKFTYWNNNTKDRTNPKTFYIYGDSTFTANFTQANIVHVDVTVDNPANGTATGGGDYYEQEEITLTAFPNEGKRFNRWEKQSSNGTWSSVSYTNPYVLRVSGNATYRATFEESYPVNVTITSANETQGTVRVTPQKTTYYAGETITVEAIPEPCYALNRWSDNNTANPRTILLTSDVSLQASFRQVTTTVTFQGESNYGNVRIVENNNDFALSAQYTGCAGDEITVEASAIHEGGFFERWSDGNTDNPRIYTVPDSKTTIQAVFNENTFGGYCGYASGSKPSENAWWTYDRYNNIRIEGTGKIYEYRYQFVSGKDKLVSNGPWYSRLSGDGGQTGTLTVESGITNIPSYVFCACEGLTRVNLKHSSITSINNCSFERCTNLEEIILPDSLKTIQNQAFDNCPLKEIIFPKSLTTIENNPFRYCRQIKRIIFQNPEPLSFYAFTWAYVGTDTIFVPGGSRQAYIDAGYTSRDSYIHHVIEWHSLHTNITGNGTCVADTTTFIAAGDTVQLTPLPEEGWEVKSIQVKDDAGNSIPVSADFRFEMPESDATVSIVFKIIGEGIESIPTPSDQTPVKIMRDNTIYILRGDRIYTLTGLQVH